MPAVLSTAVGVAASAALAYPLVLIVLAINKVRKIDACSPDPEDTHEQRLQRVLDHVREHGVGNKIQKSSNSNRFEYGNIFLNWVGSVFAKSKALPMAPLRHVLSIDTDKGTVTAEGGCTMKSLADALLPRGFMLAIHIEMHEITVGGAVAGIGIESSGYRHGFFHDTLLEADVLCADGKIRTANASNEHSDLFRALPNSYGTVGYITKATLRIVPAAPYVHMRTHLYTSLEVMLRDMGKAAEAKEVDFLEAYVFSETHSVLCESSYQHEAPETVDNIHSNQYHKLLQQKRDVYLRTHDYTFRFEPDLFCNWHDNAWFEFLRWALPPRLRSSRCYRCFFGFEAKVDYVKELFLGKMEPLIQDWEVPWSSGCDFVREVLSGVTIPEGKPWLIFAIQPKSFPTGYPLLNEMYLNLGVYLKDVGKDDGRDGGFGRTKLIDALAFRYKGIKMLYSTSFASKAQYMERYNGKAYEEVKAKYDPARAFKTVFQKCFNNVYS